jgi:hypothetical protein
VAIATGSYTLYDQARRTAPSRRSGRLRWAATGAVGVLVLGPVEIALYMLACAAATVAVTAIAKRLIALPRRGADDGGRGGGGEPPPWWPEFERAFRRYARERERARA